MGFGVYSRCTFYVSCFRNYWFVMKTLSIIERLPPYTATKNFYPMFKEGDIVKLKDGRLDRVVETRISNGSIFYATEIMSLLLHTEVQKPTKVEELEYKLSDSTK